MPRNQSIASRATRAANSGQLDLIGISGSAFVPVKFDDVVSTLYDLALYFIQVARKELESADKVSSGGLSDSIIPLDTVINGNVYSLKISVADYYDFINKGVKGWQKGGGNSPYQFKRPLKRSKGNGEARASKMVVSIRKWLTREGLSQSAREVGNRKSNARDSARKRRAKFTDTSTRTAIIIASQVRRHGIEPSGFWDKAQSETEKIMSERFGYAITTDIITNLTS